MDFKWPYIMQKFTAYKGDKHITQLSLALWLMDDYTKKEPIGQIKVLLKEGGIKDEECYIETKKDFFSGIKNPSGYHIFTDLLPGTYSLCIQSDLYFPEKRTIPKIKDVILEFDGTGPAKDKTDTKLKDDSKLKNGETVEFRNPKNDVEQRQITNITDKTISWTEKIKYDFSLKGSTIHVLRLLEFDSTGPANDKTSTELKDASRLEADDIVEFQNRRGDVEQRKITGIIGNKTIVWAEKLKYDFSTKGSTVRVLNYLIYELFLKPRPYYPFPDHATLVRGLIYDSENKPVGKVRVEVKDKIETISDENGEFVLYFIKTNRPIEMKINEIVQPDKVDLEIGKTKILGKIVLPL